MNISGPFKFEKKKRRGRRGRPAKVTKTTKLTKVQESSKENLDLNQNNLFAQNP